MSLQQRIDEAEAKWDENQDRNERKKQKKQETELLNQVRANEEAVGSLMKKEKEKRTQRIQKKMESEKKQHEFIHIEEENKKEEEKQGECVRELVKWNDLCLSHLGLEGPLEDALQQHCQQSFNSKTLSKQIDGAREKCKQIQKKLDEKQILFTALKEQVDESVLQQLHEQREEKNQLEEALQIIVRDLSECEVRKEKKDKL